MSVMYVQLMQDNLNVFIAEMPFIAKRENLNMINVMVRRIIKDFTCSRLSKEKSVNSLI